MNNDDYFYVYVVNKGDTLYNISKRYNINPELLAGINGIKLDDYIYDGQKLIIPKSNYSYYIVKSGDTLLEVAKMFKIDVDKLLSDNKNIYLMEGQILVNNKSI